MRIVTVTFVQEKFVLATCTQGCKNVTIFLTPKMVIRTFLSSYMNILMDRLYMILRNCLFIMLFVCNLDVFTPNFYGLNLFLALNATQIGQICYFFPKPSYWSQTFLSTAGTTVPIFLLLCTNQMGFDTIEINLVFTIFSFVHEMRMDPCSDPEFELHNHIDYARQSCFSALGS